MKSRSQRDSRHGVAWWAEAEARHGRAWRGVARQGRRAAALASFLKVAPFEAKGKVAEWRLIYDYISNLNVGEVVRYDALDEILGRSFLNEGAKRNPFERARRELEQVAHRTLAVVRSVGYRVVQAGEHVDLSRDHQKRGRRQVVRANQKLEATNLAALTDLERRRHEDMSIQVSKLLADHKRVERKIDRLGRLLEREAREGSPTHDT